MGEPVATAPAHVSDKLHAPFDKLLQKHVRDQRVDYLTWRDTAADSAALDSYLEALAAAKTEEWPEANRLAFYINLYNAAMIDTVLDRVDADYSPAAGDFSVFKDNFVQLGAEKVSLNHIEHEIVRKTFGEPRIHVALVCGARSCPPLLARAYRGEDLTSVLDANMRSFVTSGERNQIQDNSLKLSQIFEWFADDFGGKDQIASYVNRYVDGRDVSGYSVSFEQYSWVLNLAAPSGTWMQVKTASGGLDVGALVEVLSSAGDKSTVRRPGGGEDVAVATATLAPHSF